MKRLLPALIIVFFFGFLAFIVPLRVQAQTNTPIPTRTPTLTPTPTREPSALDQNTLSPVTLPTNWIIDSEVTSIGKNAARAGMFLDWALQNYDWSYVDPQKTNPLIPFWITLRNTVYAILMLMIIVGSIVLIVTRGRSVTLRRFLPRFLLIAVLVTFSFTFLQVLYQIVDIFQGFFVRPGNVPISQRDLLYVGWKYQPFVGLRALGDANYESAFISLLLVKLTAFTYYVMVGILLVRKIILWFFIMISPFFPLLLLFYPLRNTAKIWLGEFFRWLLYAPLFAIFLAGLVSVWKLGIPLFFNFANVGQGVIFPTAVSILLGGPLQNVTVANSVNLADTFGQYLVALMMLWMVIIFPFILLQIFLDYLSNVNLGNTALAKQLVNIVNKFPQKPPSTPPPSYQPTGLARAMPFIRDFTTPVATTIATPVATGLAREIPRSTSLQKSSVVSKEEKEKIAQIVSVEIPTLRDIARFDSSHISATKDKSHESEYIAVKEKLEKIANPQILTSTSEKDHYSNIKESLLKESQSGNPLASSLLSAVKNVSNNNANATASTTTITTILNQLANPATITNTTEREKISSLKEKITIETRNNTSSLASSLSTALNTRESKTPVDDLARVLRGEGSTEKRKDSLQEMKQILIKEKEQGNQFATTVLSAFEHFEEFEKAKEELLAVANPQTVEMRTVYEKLVKEKESGNAVASTVLSSLEKLTTSTSSNQQEEVIVSLKETLVKENSNELASLLLSKIPSLAHYEKTKNEVIIKQIEEANKNGDPLAKQLLKVASETSNEAREEQTKSLEEQISQGNKNGDPLAKLLYGMMTTQSVGDAKTQAKLPISNRIQEVSLDDYEAVKKMWTESYQNVQTEGGMGDQQAKRISIADDVKKIQDTIDLLSSNDEEKIADGMQSVSDILPFLLIGGFSQSEIIAYLKAKMEAGKSVLTEIDKTISDEDTKIEVTHKTVEKHAQAASMSASAVIDEVNSTRSQPPLQTIRANPPTAKTQTFYQSGIEMLRLANISIPNMRSLAQFDEAMTSHNVERSQEVAKITSTLNAIAHPQIQKESSQQEKFSSIQGALNKEVERGSVIAKSVQDAAIASSRLSHVEKLQEILALHGFLQTLSQVKNKSLKHEAVEKIFASLNEKEQHGDQIAAHIIKASEDAEKIETMLPVYDRLKSAQSEGNQTATEFFANLAKTEFAKKETLDEVIQALAYTDDSSQKNRLDGNVIAQQILSLASQEEQQELASFAKSLRYIASPSLVADVKDKASYEDLRKRLEKEIVSGNVLANQILTVAVATESGSLSAIDKSSLAVLLQEKLIAAAQESNPLALQIELLTHEMLQAKSLHFFLGRVISDLLKTERIVLTKKREQYQKVRDMLFKAKTDGNHLASVIIETGSLHTPAQSVLQALHIQLETEEKKGDILAKEILGLLVREQESDQFYAVFAMLHAISDISSVKDQDEKDAYESLIANLHEQSQSGDILAMTILSASEIVQKTGDAVAEAKKILEVARRNSNSVVGVKVHAILEKETKSHADILELRSLLSQLANKDLVTNDLAKQQLQKLHAELQEEAKHGNEVSMQLIPLLEEFSREDFSFDAQMQAALRIYQVLRQKQAEGNARADELLAIVGKRQEEKESEALVSVLTAIANPENLMQQGEQDVYKKLKETLIVRRNNSDPLAGLLLSLAQSFARNHMQKDDQRAVISLLTKKLEIEKEKGNTFAQAIFALVNAQNAPVASLEGDILTASKKDDPLAREILSLVQDDAVVHAGTLVLPSENLVQEVSLDDYDAVRQMWTESYRSLEVPMPLDGKKRSRADWLTSEILHLQEVVDLLLNSDPKLQNKGIQAVSRILPFVLLGGFSLSEVISYLKAKIQAAQAVRSEIGQEKEEIFAKASSEEQKNDLEEKVQS